MRQPVEQVRTIHLDHEQLLVLDSGREGRVRVLYGGAWLTESGEQHDAFLCTGHEAAVHGGLAVLQAQGGTDLVLTLGRKASLAWWRHVRSWAARLHLGPSPEPCR